jgi:spore coat polysaccharide biosynthesis predicted glycosyltransferase SpsG
LLHQGFWSCRHKPRVIPEHAANLLVTLGGSDPGNVTLKLIQALNRLDGINVRVVVGAANPHRASLEQAVARTGIQLLAHVENMPELITWADMAVAGGATLWETALLVSLPGNARR